MEGLPESYLVPPTEFEKFAEQRRLSANGLLWQVPGLSLTAQAFLIGAAIDPDTETEIRIAVAGLAALIAVATMQLLLRHRYREQVFSHALDVSRAHNGLPPFDFPDLFEKLAARRIKHEGTNLVDWQGKRLLRVAFWPAWKTWTSLFVCFIALDLFVMIEALF